jgi:hypothetical protein
LGIGYSYPHFLRLFSEWTYLDFFASILVSFSVEQNPSDIAKSIIFPASAIFIGFTISWGANAQTLIMSKEIKRLSKYNSDGMENYIFPFHLAIFAFIFAVSMWGIAAIGVFDPAFVGDKLAFLRISGLFACVFLTCMALRICWSVTVMIGVFMFAISAIRDERKFKIKKNLLKRWRRR